MAALMLGLIAMTGCDTDNNEHQRLVAEADLVNAGGPLVLAAMNTGSPSDANDNFVPIEFVNVVFSARPLNDTMVIPQGSPYSTFNVTSYDMIWRPGPGAPAALTDYNVTRSNLTVTVPVDDEAVAAILVGNVSMKTEPWFPGNPFTADLEIIFYGHESGSEHEVALHAGINVQFVATISDQ